MGIESFSVPPQEDESKIKARKELEDARARLSEMGLDADHLNITENLFVDPKDGSVRDRETGLNLNDISLKFAQLEHGEQTES